MRLIKLLICLIKGHDFKEPSLVNTINKNNWLKRCSRCGCYVMHGDIGQIIVTGKDAYKIKKEFEEKFPYSVRGGDQMNQCGLCKNFNKSRNRCEVKGTFHRASDTGKNACFYHFKEGEPIEEKEEATHELP